MSRKTLTVQEVSEETGIPVSTVYHMLETGQLPALRTGSRWRVRESTLDGWLHEREAATQLPDDTHTPQPTTARTP